VDDATAASSPLAPPAGAWDGAWEAALDELELSLDEAERLLGATGADGISAPTAWTPPSIPVPLPAAMLDRAQDLVARQQIVMTRTVAAMTETRRSLALVDRVNDVTAVRRTDRPVYVDVRA
jgi:hypothetical protein